MSDPDEAPTAGARERAVARFQARWGIAPTHLIRSPGRINLIGEHTDYHEGYVLPVALDQATWLALRARDDDRVHLEAEGQAGELDLNLQKFSKGEPSWQEQVKGVARALQGAGAAVRGWQGIAATDLPDGGGLGSTASFAVALVRAFGVVAGADWHAIAAAQVALKAEREWSGQPCALVDYLAVASGQEGFATLVDCRTLEMRPVPLPSAFTLVVLDARVPRGSAGHSTQQRQLECAQVLQKLGVPALRDVSISTFAVRGLEFNALSRRRARHVVTENERVLQAARSLNRGDGEGLGILMNMSHNSLRDDYDVTSPGQDLLAQMARSINGCAGARMTGVGSGGCVLAVVANWASAAFQGQIGPLARQHLGHDISTFPLRSAFGTSAEPW
jgi:galactokinase